ncbi:MAG: hypothetical protein UX62_C0010G0012, partial [Microgenomates group bacterium GW2011_GWA2_46_7]
GPARTCQNLGGDGAGNAGSLGHPGPMRLLFGAMQALAEGSPPHAVEENGRFLPKALPAG